MIVSLLLIVAGVIGLSALLYRLALYALPAFVGFFIAFGAHHAGMGMIGALVLGAFAAGVAFAVMLGLLAATRSVPLRALILLAFTLPAATMGYGIVVQLAEFGGMPSVWREVLAIAGAIAVGFSAARRLSQSSTQPRPGVVT